MSGITVIIPTYNRGEYLERALCSVAGQSLACDEIIVVDDGSRDGSRELVGNFALHSPVKVTYLYQENQGPSAARNKGIEAAAFSYLAFLDSDDHWHKDKLQMQYEAMNGQPDCLISHTGERWLRRGEHLNQKKKHKPGNGDIFNHCLKLCAVGMSTVMVKKEIFDYVGLFDEGLRCCEDYDLWLRVSCRFPFLLLDVPLTVKEGGREDQVSWQYRVGMDRFRIYAIQKLLRENVLSVSQKLEAKAELKRKCLVYGNGCVKHGRPEEGMKYLDTAKVISS